MSFIQREWLGDFDGAISGTLNITMPQVVKEKVTEHLDNKKTSRDTYQFGSTEEALLSLDDQTFESLRSQGSRSHSAELESVHSFKTDANYLLENLRNAISEANQTPGGIKGSLMIKECLDDMDKLAKTKPQQEWLARQLNQQNQRNFQQLLNYALYHKGNSTVLASAVYLMTERDVTTIADNLLKELIYPALMKPRQSSHNEKLLHKVEVQLKSAKTKQEVNDALDEVIKHYKSRLPFSKFKSSTPEM